MQQNIENTFNLFDTLSIKLFNYLYTFSIVKEAVKIIRNWDTVERSPEANVVFFDNNKQQAEVVMDLGI